MLDIDRNLVSKYAAFHCDAMIRTIDAPKRVKGLQNRAYFERRLSQIFPTRKGIKLEQVILAEPEELEQLLNIMDGKAFNKIFVATIKKGAKGSPRKKVKPATTQFLKLYKLLDNRRPFDVGGAKGKWGRHDFFKMLGYATCPYCNRNIMQIVDDGVNSWQSGDLDHVFPKKKFPMFCVSFYNLIPACKVCNFFKNEKENPIPNPYDVRYKITKQFRFTISDIKAGFPMKAGSFKVSPKINPAIENQDLGKKIDNLLTICKIKMQYEQHFDVAQEVVQKEFVFDKSYRDELWNRYEGTLFLDKRDLDRAIFGRHVGEEELHRRPLSKFIRDIQEHLNGDADWMEEIPEADLREVRKKVKEAKNNTSLI